ncbi:MAG: sporulation integral membrane protein YlbJ [Firmicutes bacterium]|nr:sporulation integral membrane protein YlbJ [Bacillota bacterium]
MLTNTAHTRWSTRFQAALAVLLTVTIVRYPQVAFHASLEGLKIWFDIVLPALLPFFAMSEILMGLGVVHFMGVLLEPLMRPLFRLPGTGAFAVAMGLASGYPIGAKITGQLRRENLCTGPEGERLIALANTADPLFMVGAVAVGMFGMEEIGWTIAAAHYLSVLLVGLLLRFYPDPSYKKPPKKSPKRGVSMLARAFDEMELARLQDGRPFGQLFGDAIKNSFTSMLFVGGCIMVFSVLGRIADVAGVTNFLQGILESFVSIFGVDTNIIPAVLRGFTEITIGCEAASQAASSLFWRTVTASLIIGWSGLSVHAQVATMIHGTDIRLRPYLVARLAHGILAAAFTAILWRPISKAFAVQKLPFLAGSYHTAFLPRLTLAAGWSILAVAVLLGLGLGLSLLGKIKIISIRIP